jgi:acetyl esterase/lipase
MPSLVVRVTGWAVVLAVTGALLRSQGPRAELPDGVRVDRDLGYGSATHDGGTLDLYRPQGPAPPGGWPVVVAIHGGGWRGGDKGPFGRSLTGLVRHGLAVAAVNYRLSRPDRPIWPANFEAVREAVRWIRHHAPQLGLDGQRIAALGASAGGHLAALLGTETEDPTTAVAAVVDFYGPTDLPELCGPVAAPGGPVALLLGTTAGAAPDLAHSASPAQRVTSRSAPMLIFHGRDDRLIPVEQSSRLANALEAAGVRHRLVLLDDAAHGFGLVVGGHDLTPEILAFLNRSWNDDSAQGP